jgi:hypothetical protein
MDDLIYCLYLPGICIHVSSVSCDTDTDTDSDTGRSELHFDVNPFPQDFVFHFFKSPPLHQHPAFEPFTPPYTPALASMASASSSPLPSPQLEYPDGHKLAKLISDDKAFENTSTSVAASQMRNALNNLADTVQDPEEKKVCFAHTLPPQFQG